jgi:hypothetical protein
MLQEGRERWAACLEGAFPFGFIEAGLQLAELAL